MSALSRLLTSPKPARCCKAGERKDVSMLFYRLSRCFCLGFYSLIILGTFTKMICKATVHQGHAFLHVCP
jgi:hypothetical protein